MQFPLYFGVFGYSPRGTYLFPCLYPVSISCWSLSRVIVYTQVLVKRGLRSVYEEKTDNLRCFRGKLQVAGHIRRNIAHKERFYVTYEEFTKNRPENRLIKATLKNCRKLPQTRRTNGMPENFCCFLTEYRNPWITDRILSG